MVCIHLDIMTYVCIYYIRATQQRAAPKYSSKTLLNFNAAFHLVDSVQVAPKIKWVACRFKINHMYDEHFRPEGIH